MVRILVYLKMFRNDVLGYSEVHKILGNVDEGEKTLRFPASNRPSKIYETRYSYQMSPLFLKYLQAMTQRARQGSLLPVVILLRQSQAFFVVYRNQFALERSFHFTKARATVTLAPSSTTPPPAVSAASLLRKRVIARSIMMSSTGSCVDESYEDTNEGVREVSCRD